MLSAPRKWIVFALIFLGIVVSYIDRGNLSLATQPILRDFHLNPKDMGVLLSAFFWTYALFQLPAGYLIDRFGIRTVYAAAFTLWSLASASIAISRGPGDIIASRLLLGFAESVGPLASLAFIRSHYLPQERGLPTALYIGGQTLGPAFGTLLGVSVMAHYGWRALFAFTGLAAVIWVPAWLAASPRVPSRSITNSKLALSFLLARRDVWAIAGAIFFSSYFWWFVMNWMPGYLTLSRGFSTSDMGTTFSIPLFAMTVTNLISGWLADRIISKRGQDHKIRMALAIIGLILASFLLLFKQSVIPRTAGANCLHLRLWLGKLQLMDHRAKNDRHPSGRQIPRLSQHFVATGRRSGTIHHRHYTRIRQQLSRCHLSCRRRTDYGRRIALLNANRSKSRPKSVALLHDLELGYGIWYSTEARYYTSGVRNPPSSNPGQTTRELPPSSLVDSQPDLSCHGVQKVL